MLHTDRGELVRARHHLGRALDMRARLYGNTGVEYAAVLQHVAYLEQLAGNRDKALAMHHEARTLMETNLGLAHPETLAVLSGEGAMLFHAERYPEAAALLERGLAAVETSIGMDSDLGANVLVNLGLARWKLGKLADARTTFERALAIAVKRGPETPRVATLHFNLALVLYDLALPVLARAHAVDAAALYQRLGDAASEKQAREIIAVIDEA